MVATTRNITVYGPRLLTPELGRVTGYVGGRIGPPQRHVDQVGLDDLKPVEEPQDPECERRYAWGGEKGVPFDPGRALDALATIWAKAVYWRDADG